MSIEKIVNISLWAVPVLAVAAFLIRFIRIEYHTAKIRNAPEVTVRATAWYKDPDSYPVMAGRSTNYVYHITFHTESGEAVTLYMNRDAYFNIPEGASGVLLYQGKKLWRFTFDNGTEIRQ